MCTEWAVDAATSAHMEKEIVVFSAAIAGEPAIIARIWSGASFLQNILFSLN